uniref:Proton channel OtopLc-like n=1 Tax=Heterorhabditis bacteriophora TaxID=37862 RepID=A0A1I7XEC6_HETBA
MDNASTSLEEVRSLSMENLKETLANIKPLTIRPTGRGGSLKPEEINDILSEDERIYIYLYLFKISVFRINCEEVVEEACLDDDHRHRMTSARLHSREVSRINVVLGEEERKEKLSRQNSTFSIESNSEALEQTSAEDMWIHNKAAKTSMMTALTAFYCLFLTIFALVLELSHLLSGEDERKINSKDLIFGIYMYGISILFFFYMYVVLLLNPRWYSTMEHLRRMFHCCASVSESSSISSAAATIRKVTHNSPSAGSLFLRLGCVVFGVIGVVYYAFLVFLCSADQGCSSLSTSLDLCAIVFIFTQMHFIFCNWKLSITGSHMMARIGTMHLIAANLWTWIRYVLMEEGVMEKEINTKWCMSGSLSEVMFTAIVEYSLIAAAVMYIVWRNIGRADHGSTYVRRKHQIRVDCSKTTTGLFLGLAFLAATFTSMVVYYGYSILGKSKHAAFVYAFTDIFQYIGSTIGCVLAIYQMRALKYLNKKNKQAPKDQELLDQILLSVGLIGELIYSVAGLVGLTGDGAWQPLTFVLLFVHICRLVQVGVQTFLLYLAARVKVGALDRETQPGKQAITFLLTANLAIFLMNLFESEKAGVSEIIIVINETSFTDFYGKRSWVFLVRSFSPLNIFYRFHSSVCLAEIWKNVYASKF